jgi:hypothetical protein
MATDRDSWGIDEFTGLRMQCQRRQNDFLPKKFDGSENHAANSPFRWWPIPI